MEHSRSELTTVRKMIDAAFVFGEDEPVVDFKLLEAILFIIGRQLNVLERSVMVKMDKIKKHKLKMKTTVAITEIKVHRKIGKRTKGNITDSTTEKSSSFKPQHKKRSSRQRSRSKSKRGYKDDDDDDDEDYKKHRPHKYGHDKDSKKHRSGYDEDYQKHERYRHDDDQGPRKRDEDSKKHRGGYDEDYQKHERYRHDDDQGPRKRDEDSKKHGRHRGGYDEDYQKHERYRHDDDQGPRKRDEDSKRQGRRFRDDSRDVLHEKILVVSRSSLDGMHERDHRSAVVTQKQYDKILSEVRRLQDKFGIVSNIDTSWFNLHQQTSATHPRAALNMATRLEIAYKKVTQMIDIVTKFASAIPGFNIEEVLEDSLLNQIYKETPSSKTPKSTNKTSSELVDQDEAFLEEIPLGEENLATWTEFNADMDEIQQNVCQHMSKAATAAAETAKRANKLFTQTAPRLSEASILNVKFARCRILVDRFSNSATALDVKMASQMGDCQEIVSQLQFEVETMVERVDDVLAHPAEDPGAVAALKDEFSILQGDLAEAKKNQEVLKQLHDLSDLDFELIRKRLEMISRNKTTREEALEHLTPKARVDDVNSLLSRDQLYAVVGFLQKKINQTHGIIDSGEVRWQHCIDDYIAYLNEKGDRLQLLSLQQSLRNYVADINSQVNFMLDIVGDFPVNVYHKKLDRDSNCLCCGTPANVKVTEKNIKLAKRLISHSRPLKPLVIEEKDTEKPCFPGRPIPHPLDPRALVCDRYCGASTNKSEESLTTTMDVADMNPTHRNIQNRVHLTCTPCTHSEDNLIK